MDYLVIKKLSFTLIEIIIGVVILGILATWAIPHYSAAIERSRGKQAEINLIAIYNSEKRYRLDNSQYYTCQQTGCSQAGIGQALNLNITDSYFAYEIENTPDGFKATATRNDEGICASQIMSLSQSGSEATKECNFW